VLGLTRLYTDNTGTTKYTDVSLSLIVPMFYCDFVN